MRSPLYISAVALLILSCLPECRAQEYEWGIGMVISPYNVGAIIFSRPNVASDTIASVSGFEFTIYPAKEKVRGFLVGFQKYDDHGLPILSITSDSSWARVSVQSSDGTAKTEGWIRLKVPNTSIRIWEDFLITQSAMVLRTDRPLRFFSRPNLSAELKIKLFRFRSPFDEYSYILKPIRREGHWLLVELQTPFLPCGSDESIEKNPDIQPRTIKLWIQYVDEQGRPLVQAPMMC